MASKSALIDHGKFIVEEDERRKEEQLRKFVRSKNARDATSKEIDAGKRAGAPEKISEMQRELQAVHHDDTVTDEQHLSDVPISPSRSPLATSVPSLPYTLLPSSMIRRVHIGSSTSSKLDYLLNEVLDLLV